MIEFGDRRLSETFWSKVTPEPNSGCWLWTGATNRGDYGVYWVQPFKTVMLAHRASYAFLVAEPGDLNVCHRCDIPPCVYPGHLFLGDQAANVADMMKKGRDVLHGPALVNAQKTHCLNGHPLAGPHVRMWRGSRICNICHAERARATKQRSMK